MQFSAIEYIANIDLNHKDLPQYSIVGLTLLYYLSLPLSLRFFHYPLNVYPLPSLPKPLYSSCTSTIYQPTYSHHLCTTCSFRTSSIMFIGNV